MQRYPMMLYRPGSSLRVWNAHDVDTLLVHSEEEEATAKRQGWRNRPGHNDPLDHDHDGRKGGSRPGRRKRIVQTQ